MNVIDVLTQNAKISAKAKLRAKGRTKAPGKDKTRAKRAMEANIRDSLEWPKIDAKGARASKVRFLLPPVR